MPPRYAYWTILVDDQPTAFRAGAKEDLLPTFNRLKEKHASAAMMWFQNGKLWPSRLDAQEAMRARGEKGRRGDARQGGGFRDRSSSPPASDRPRWSPKPANPQARKPNASGKLEWKPKGTFTPEPKRSERSEWRPSRSEKLDWKPRTESRTRHPEPGTRAKRAWIPREEYKKSKGIETPRDGKWRPGGEHRDPRQKYKDAKKAKWTRFKQNVRQRWEKKQGRKKDDDK
jgi:hypothetical protein